MILLFSLTLIDKDQEVKKLKQETTKARDEVTKVKQQVEEERRSMASATPSEDASTVASLRSQLQVKVFKSEIVVFKVTGAVINDLKQ